MDPFLAEYYGTGNDEIGYDEDALEKMAQLTLLTKEAEEEGIDLSELSEEELLALSEEVYGADPMEKEASDMFETADFSGRIMAHSMWNELEAIQKQAGWAGDAASKARGAASSAWEGAKRTGAYLKRRAAAGARSMTPTQLGSRTISSQRARKVVAKHRRALLDSGHDVNKIDSEAARRASKELGSSAFKRGLGIYGAGAGTLAAAGGTAAYLRGRKEKKSSDSAFDALVEQRAMDHLYAAGYMDDQGNVYEPEYEKTASDFDNVVDSAALEYLADLGYPVE